MLYVHDLLQKTSGLDLGRVYNWKKIVSVFINYIYGIQYIHKTILNVDIFSAQSLRFLKLYEFKFVVYIVKNLL